MAKFESKTLEEVLEYFADLSFERGDLGTSNEVSYIIEFKEVYPLVSYATAGTIELDFSSKNLKFMLEESSFFHGDLKELFLEIDHSLSKYASSLNFSYEGLDLLSKEPYQLTFKDYIARQNGWIES